MHRSRLPVVGVSCALALTLVLAAESSQAGTITLQPATITRKWPSGAEADLRDQSKNPNWISREDCLNDLSISFPLYVTDYSETNGVQVWIGDSSSANCKEATTRTGNAPTCWMVASAVATSSSLTIDVKVRDIIGMHKPTVAPSGPGSGTEADCTPTDYSTTSAQAISVNFMFMTGSGTVSGTGAYWETKYDLVGPAPPTGVVVGVGDTMLKLEWSQTTDTDLTGYKFFCDAAENSTGQFELDGATSGTTSWKGKPRPLPAGDASDTEDSSSTETDADTDSSTQTEDASTGEASTTDATTTDTGSTKEASTATSSSCPTLKLVPGSEPDLSLLCGSVSGATATSGRITGLQNYTRYSIAVTGVDSVGNVGKASAIVCEAPNPVDDFFKLYKQAGGEGGGAFCSVGSVGQRAGMVGFGLLGIAALARTVRRRRGHS